MFTVNRAARSCANSRTSMKGRLNPMSETVKVAILDDYQNCALRMADWSVLPANVETTVFTDNEPDFDRLIQRLMPFQVVCAMRERTRFDREVMEKLPNLKLIATTGAWNAAIDMEAAEELGIVVSGTGAAPNSTPELTWGVILALIRQIPAEVASVRSGGWQVAVGGDLQGRTLALMGLGNIGQAMARIGKAFGMNIIAWSQNLTAEKASAAGAVLVDKQTLFREADVVTIHLVLSGRTRGLVGGSELASMKPTARLVNTSRAPIVDEEALIEALQARRIAGAAVDVFDVEPLPSDHPFRKLQNLLATPHIGYVTEDLYRTFYGDAAANIAKWLEANASAA
jgi:phosphoglycerate dehydrogenase-like enzyme